jgi:citrate lyase subunit beta/citryl-CoA lyase
MSRLLARLDIGPERLAQHLDLPPAVVAAALTHPRPAPLVMLDGEDAQALRPDVTELGRATAARVLRDAAWAGSNLRFYRPPGLNLPDAAQDLVTVLVEAGQGRAPSAYPVDGVVFPKVEQPEEVDWLMTTLQEVEQSLALEPGRIRVALLIESGWGLAQVASLAQRAMPRLCALILGLADLAADLGLPAIANYHPLADMARMQLVTVAGAAGVPAIDGMTLDYPVVDPALDAAANQERFLARVAQVYRDALHARDLGMSGKWAGHPAQLFAVLLAFEQGIDGESLEREARKLEAYRTAVVAHGQGATIVDGVMSDRATDRHAREVLRRAVAMGKFDPRHALELGVIAPEDLADAQSIWEQT